MQIFDSYIEAAQYLKPRNKEKYYTALIDYLYYGIEPSVTGEVAAVITSNWPTIEESRRKIVNGRKGGRGNKAGGENPESKTPDSWKAKPANPGKLDGENPESKTPDSGKTKGNSKGNSRKEGGSNEPPKKAGGFVKPTVEEVSAYIAERGYTFSAEEFVAFYESNGWKVGKNPMKSWQAACVTWQSKRRPQERRAVSFNDEYSAL